MYKYKIIDDYVEIYFKDKKGQNFTCLIDLEDLDKVINHKYKWYPNINHAGYYICSTIYLGYINGKPKYNKIYLHRYLLDFPEDYQVDHQNNNTLDNRKSNFRLTKNEYNTKHRKAKNSNNTSGYRNVSKINNKWVVQLIINGKNTRIAEFNDVDQAGIFAEQKRREIYGEFAGSN